MTNPSDRSNPTIVVKRLEETNGSVFCNLCKTVKPSYDDFLTPVSSAPPTPEHSKAPAVEMTPAPAAAPGSWFNLDKEKQLLYVMGMYDGLIAAHNAVIRHGLADTEALGQLVKRLATCSLRLGYTGVERVREYVTANQSGSTIDQIIDQIFDRLLQECALCQGLAAAEQVPADALKGH